MEIVFLFLSIFLFYKHLLFFFSENQAATPPLSLVTPSDPDPEEVQALGQVEQSTPDVARPALPSAVQVSFLLKLKPALLLFKLLSH